jgi:hypothetical protein
MNPTVRQIADEGVTQTVKVGHKASFVSINNAGGLKIKTEHFGAVAELRHLEQSRTGHFRRDEGS